jgi:D-amino-acid oxidase
VAEKVAVVVLGCGVIGLSAAIRLQEAGLAVRIVAQDLPPDTTSSVAAAIWYPYRAYPAEKVLDWGGRSFAVFEELASTPNAGIRMRVTKEFFRSPVPDAWWAAAVSDFRRCREVELPAGFRDGFVFTTAVVEMPVYLPYLLRQFRAGGGLLEQRKVRSLADLEGWGDVVVNCSGLGARLLADDPSVAAIRGQIVRVDNPGIDEVLLDEGDPSGITYIVPRSTDCILGGTAEVGAENLEPDPAIARGITDRCARLEPRLRGARVLGHRVGLRPGRPTIRLELAELPGSTPCVHNYGHGGAGVTLSWGCADDVLRLIQLTLG